jgi:hypothetical protein
MAYNTEDPTCQVHGNHAQGPKDGDRTAEGHSNRQGEAGNKQNAAGKCAKSAYRYWKGLDSPVRQDFPDARQEHHSSDDYGRNTPEQF